MDRDTNGFPFSIFSLNMIGEYLFFFFREFEEDNRCSIWLTFNESLSIFSMNLPKEWFGSHEGLSM
jgi:hypothetical protein